MNVIWKAACAAALLLAATSIETGCGDTYRPIATPLPVTTGNPSGAETEVVLSCCLSTANPVSGSVLTAIDASGDTNVGNKPIGNVANSIAFDYNRTTVFTTNVAASLTPNNYSLTQVLLNTSTAGFSANATTISLDSGAAPIGMSFQYFGSTYSVDYAINSGTTTTCPSGGSLSAIAQASAELKATICVGVNPVAAWIYKDQTKVFVLDKTENQVYVVSASKFKWTNKITLPANAAPIKVAQSADGNYIYVVNSGSRSISIIDGQAETELGAVSTDVNTASLVSTAAPIDIAQNVQYNDTSKNLQYNRIWVLQADGTVSIYDATTPGTLKWVTSFATITPAQKAAGAVPTNLALLRDGTEAYVGLAGTDQIVGIDTSKLATGGITTGATTSITVGTHRSITQSLKDTKGNAHSVLVETTTPTVSLQAGIAVSRGGATADLSKVYAATTTNTTYFCYDADVNPTDCSKADPWDGTGSFLVDNNNAAVCVQDATNPNAMNCPNLYNGTAVVTAAANGSTPVNTYVTTIPSPSVVTYCDPGNPATGIYDGQKNCPVTVPKMVLGRS